jgi:hypothetical protein
MNISAIITKLPTIPEVCEEKLSYIHSVGPITDMRINHMSSCIHNVVTTFSNRVNSGKTLPNHEKMLTFVDFCKKQCTIWFKEEPCPDLGQIEKLGIDVIKSMGKTAAQTNTYINLHLDA